MATEPHVLSICPATAQQVSGGEIVLVSGSTRLAAAYIALPVVDPQDFENARWLLEDLPRLHTSAASPVADRIEGRLSQYGRDLGEMLFGGSDSSSRIAAVLAETQESIDVRIQERPVPGWLPWELLTVPGMDQPLALAARSFIRCDTPWAEAPAPREVSGALRVLLVIARPAGEDDVPFRSVASRLVRMLATRSPVPLEFDLLRPPTYAALARRLERATAAGRPYDLMHFDGHGVYSRSAPGEAPRGYLCFEAESRCRAWTASHATS